MRNYEKWKWKMLVLPRLLPPASLASCLLPPGSHLLPSAYYSCFLLSFATLRKARAACDRVAPLR